MTDRPSGITALSGFSAVVGVASIIVGITQGSVLSLAIGLAQFIAAYGLWTLSPWGGVVAGAVYVFDGLRKSIDVLAGEPVAAGGLVVNAAIVVYLYVNRKVFDERN